MQFPDQKIEIELQVDSQVGDKADDYYECKICKNVVWEA